MGAKAPSTWGHLLLLSQVHQQGAGSDVEQPGHELVSIREAGTVDCSLTCYAETLAQLSILKASLTQLPVLTPLPRTLGLFTHVRS